MMKFSDLSTKFSTFIPKDILNLLTLPADSDTSNVSAVLHTDFRSNPKNLVVEIQNINFDWCQAKVQSLLRMIDTPTDSEESKNSYAQDTELFVGIWLAEVSLDAWELRSSLRQPSKARLVFVFDNFSSNGYEWRKTVDQHYETFKQLMSR